MASTRHQVLLLCKERVRSLVCDGRAVCLHREEVVSLLLGGQVPECVLCEYYPRLVSNVWLAPLQVFVPPTDMFAKLGMLSLSRYGSHRRLWRFH